MSDHDLAQAFEILLRRPLTDFDAEATYALYHWDDMQSSEFFHGDFDLGLLTRGEILPPSAGVDGTFSSHVWPVDLGRSMFLIEADVPKLLRSRSGAKVGRVLAEEGLTAADLEDEWARIELRVHTDGTLFDAMRAATWTMGDPPQLTGFDPDGIGLRVKPKWEKRLAAVPHTGLRDHLRMLCLDAHSARGDGAHFAGADHPGFDWMKRKDYQVVAAWEFGEGQATSVIAQIPAQRPAS
ncbi:hypothetical protein [Actinoplanes couchii]|uniref:Uncharacterized protein n=1 Tax=Actinoplanes couchii TaxID=403638 RepID=A0ABQ3XKL9_9ACTN|nr:hypothetical protein [Actinoplanes couchii]MDR6320584.1 hypothetical protein [Actinoplanes couchii]GID58987.1 hypothetical protein Aco03nite_073910 [Actinoplanes couchii]